MNEMDELRLFRFLSSISLLDIQIKNTVSRFGG